jgi:hypothetical protein
MEEEEDLSPNVTSLILLWSVYCIYLQFLEFFFFKLKNIQVVETKDPSQILTTFYNFL